MEKKMMSLEVTCPSCNIKKNILIPEALFKLKKFGTIKIQVPKGSVCQEHHFIVFVNNLGIIRGYDKIDMQIKASIQRTEETNNLTLNDWIQMFGLYGLFNLIHAKIFNYPVYIINAKTDEGISEMINKIFDDFVPITYQGTSSITFVKEINYEKIKLKENYILLMDSMKNILHTPWNNKLRFKFEEEIVTKALKLNNDKEQFNLIQKYILKFIEEVEDVKKILDNVKKIDERDLINQLSINNMTPKISIYKLTLIKEFMNRRLSPKLTKKITAKLVEFLKLL